MRIDTSSFIPPLLYDIYVPGTKRLPVCTVESMNITPKGKIRTMMCPPIGLPNNTNNTNITANIPEAWEISITFKSLIAPSLNLMFDGYFGGAKIEVQTSSAAAPVTSA